MRIASRSPSVRIDAAPFPKRQGDRGADGRVCSHRRARCSAATAGAMGGTEMIRIRKTRTLYVALCLLLVLATAFAAGCSSREVGTFTGTGVKFMPGATGTQVQYNGSIEVRLDSGKEVAAKATVDQWKSLKVGDKVEVEKSGSGDYTFIGPAK